MAKRRAPGQMLALSRSRRSATEVWRAGPFQTQRKIPSGTNKPNAEQNGSKKIPVRCAREQALLIILVALDLQVLHIVQLHNLLGVQAVLLPRGQA